MQIGVYLRLGVTQWQGKCVSYRKSWVRAVALKKHGNPEGQVKGKN